MGVVKAQDYISRGDFESRMSSSEARNSKAHTAINTKIDNMATQDSDYKALIEGNTVAINGLKGTLDRVQDMLERIFLLMIGSVLTGIIGGGGLGYAFARGKN